MKSKLRVHRAFHPDGGCYCYEVQEYVKATGLHADGKTYYWKNLTPEPFARYSDAEEFKNRY